MRNLCSELEITPNTAINQRNNAQNDDIFIDDLLYEQRYSIEKTNAWLGCFRTILNRFDATTQAGQTSIRFLVLFLVAR